MPVKISDLLPAPIEVAVARGKPPMTLRHLELAEIINLLFTHKEDMVAIYVESQSPKPDFIKFISLAPGLCADCIAMSADDLANSHQYRKLPFSVQLVALEKIWEASVPDPKAFGEMLGRLVNELKRLSEKHEAEVLPSAESQPRSQ